MKLMISGVTFSAAIVRSPSFSRSSSSTTTTIFPSRMSSIASGMLVNGIMGPQARSARSAGALPARPLAAAARGQEPFHVLRDHVHLQVHGVTDPRVPEVGNFQCIRDQSHSEGAGAEGGHGQGEAIYGHRARLYQIALQPRGRLHRELGR